MYKCPLFFCIVLLPSVLAANIGQLPVVNSEKTVSALDLYGLPPIKAEDAGMKARAGNPVILKSQPLTIEAELLIPNKPAGDLWSNNLGGEIPLRMPNRAEYSVLQSDFQLPEESLDEEYFEKIADDETDFLAVQSKPSISSRVANNSRLNVVRSVERAKDIPISQQKSRPDVARDLPPPVPVQEFAAPSVQRKASRQSPTVIRSNPNFASVSKVPAPKSKTVSNDEKLEDLENRFAYKGEVPLTKLSPAQLKRAFKKTFTSENKHLSTYQIDDGFDVVSLNEAAVGFDSTADLSEQGGVRPLEIKVGFHGDESSLSRDTYNLLTEYAAIVSNNPKRAVQISISERSTRSFEGRKLAARRLAIVEQVLRDSGIADRRIIPVLSQRNDDSFVLRVISNDTFQTLTEKKRDIFGDTTSGKTVKSMAW